MVKVEEMKVAIRSVHESVMKKDVEKLLSLFTEDVILMCPGVTLKGLEGAKRFMKWWGAQFQKFTTETTSLTIEGERAAHEYVLEGTTPEGLTVRFDGVAIYEFKDGKILRIRNYFDVLTVAKQVVKGFIAKRAVKSVIDRYEKGLR